MEGRGDIENCGMRGGFYFISDTFETPATYCSFSPSLTMDSYIGGNISGLKIKFRKM